MRSTVPTREASSPPWFACWATSTSPKESIAGFAVLQVDSREEAIKWATCFADVIGNVEIEVRRVIEISDVAPENDPTEEGGQR